MPFGALSGKELIVGLKLLQNACMRKKASTAGLMKDVAVDIPTFPPM